MTAWTGGGKQRRGDAVKVTTGAGESKKSAAAGFGRYLALAAALD